jgi:hypothetical protein
MEATATACQDSSHKNSLIQVLHEKHAAECAFLRACCDESSLSEEQRLTILGLIDRLTEQEKILEWVMGLVKPLNNPRVLPPVLPPTSEPIRQDPEFARP